MPKPRNWSSNYNENNYTENTAKRVSFKHRRAPQGNNTGRNRHWEAGVRSHLEEEDVDMAGLSNGGAARYTTNYKKGRKGGRGGYQSGAPKRKLFESPTNFYQIYMPYGNKYEKPFLLQTLLDKISPLPLIPIMWSTKDNSAMFYVDDFKTAEKLNNLNKEIQLPDGFKLIIKVSGGMPTVNLNTSVKEKMKLVMAKRYDANTKALDMSKFHLDPDLHDVFCGLFKPVVSLAAVNIISENIPEIEALSWNDNKIQILSHLMDIGKKLPNLKIFHIGSNKLRDMTQLDHISGLPLVELFLDGNPLCNRYKDQASYLSEVRKRFPKLLKLDGVDLPPPISFDIEDKAMPKTKQTFLCNQEGQGIVRQFLEQYMQIMDSDNRQPLLQAYHENAMFSVTCGYAYSQNPKNSPLMNWYQTDNRNLIRVTDAERRRKILKDGHLSIVSFLKDMPQTKHDIHGFTVDLTLFTPQMLIMTISGIFKEYKDANKHTQSILRHFMRTFTIVPAGSGFCIVNEMLHVSNATKDQIRESFKTPVVVPPSTSAATVTQTTVNVVVDDATKQQMLQAFSADSGMNLEWSQKCLQETNWDFPRAQLVFTEAKSKGVIPPEAFVK